MTGRGAARPKRVYLAGPLFSRAERAFNAALAAAIEDLGFAVFLPQRDGVEAAGPGAPQASIFELDRDKVFEADILLVVLDGRVPDEGACVELGIAYAQKRLQRRDKLLLGLHTDARAAFLATKLNPMVGMALDQVFATERELMDALRAVSVESAGA